MRFRTSQIVLAVLLALFAVWPTVMALLGVPYFALATLKTQPSGVSAIWALVPAALALASLVALWRIAMAFLLKDSAGLLRVGRAWWWLLYLGVTIIAAGIVVAAIGRFGNAPATSAWLGLSGAKLGHLVLTAFMGAKVLIPTAHLLFEKFKAKQQKLSHAL